MSFLGRGYTSEVYSCGTEFVEKIRILIPGQIPDQILDQTRKHRQEYKEMRKLSTGLFPETLYYITDISGQVEQRIIQWKINGITLREAVMNGLFDDYSARKELIRLMLQCCFVYLFSWGRFIPDIAGWPISEFLNPLASKNVIYSSRDKCLVMVDTNMSRTCTKLPLIRFLSFCSCLFTAFSLLNPLFKPSDFVKDYEYYDRQPLLRFGNSLLTYIAKMLHRSS